MHHVQRNFGFGFGEAVEPPQQRNGGFGFVVWINDQDQGHWLPELSGSSALRRCDSAQLVVAQALPKLEAYRSARVAHP